MNLNTEKLRLITYRKGMNQKEVAEVSGLAHMTINGIYNGRSCRKETAEKIAEALQVPVEHITKRG